MSGAWVEKLRADSAARTERQKLCGSCHTRESHDAIELPLSGLRIPICEACQYELEGLAC